MHEKNEPHFDQVGFLPLAPVIVRKWRCDAYVVDADVVKGRRLLFHQSLRIGTRLS